MGGGSIDSDSDNSVDDAPLTRLPTCNGATKQLQPCAISWNLDALGFCKFHSPQAAQCRGIARSTGLRCRLRWDLNALGYCRHHAASAPSASALRQCVAVARSTGQRCRIAVGIDVNGLCSVHRRTTSSTADRCQGVVLHSGEPCGNTAKSGYGYCCAAHDPALPYFSPRLFDAGDKPRALLEPLVVEVYDGRDLYHGDVLDLATPGLVELDHILEKQCFSYAFQGLVFEDREKDIEFLASVVRDNLANELSNVCLTRAATNKIKGAAVWKFLDDSLTGHTNTKVGPQPSFTSYMTAETRDGVRVGRPTTRVIVREMGRALKQCQYKMARQGETPLLEALSGQLQEVFVKMDLHVAASVQDKWDAAARQQDSQCDPEHTRSAVACKVLSVDDNSGAGVVPESVTASEATPADPSAINTGCPGENLGDGSTLEFSAELDKAETESKKLSEAD